MKKTSNLAYACLMILMVFFLINSAFTLFMPTYASENTSGLDIIMRTGLSSLFGFFISTVSRSGKTCDEEEIIEEDKQRSFLKKNTI